MNTFQKITSNLMQYEVNMEDLQFLKTAIECTEGEPIKLGVERSELDQAINKCLSRYITPEWRKILVDIQYLIKPKKLLEETTLEKTYTIKRLYQIEMEIIDDGQSENQI